MTTIEGSPSPPMSSPFTRPMRPPHRNAATAASGTGRPACASRPNRTAHAERGAHRDVHCARQDHDGHAKRDDLDGRVGHHEIAEIAGGEEGRRRHREDGEEGGQREGRRPFARPGAGGRPHQAAVPKAAAITRSGVASSRVNDAASVPPRITSTRSLMPSTSGSSEDHQDRESLRREVAHEAMNFSLRADIDPASARRGSATTADAPASARARPSAGCRPRAAVRARPRPAS